MLTKIVSHLVIRIIDCVVIVYTYTTLPIYYCIQKPWTVLNRSNVKQATREDPLDHYSPYSRLIQTIDFEAFNAESADKMLEIAAKTNGENYTIVGVKVHEDGKYFYDWFSYGHILKRIDNIAKGLQLMGVSAGDKVLIFAETRLEWMLCSFALFRLGSVVTTLFSQLGIEGIVYGINQTQVKHVIVSKQQLIRLRSVLSSTPSVQTIIDIDGMTITDGSVEIIALKEVEKNGKNSDIKLSQTSLNKREDLAVIMYTSGTTGNPKGAMATHGQLVAQAKALFCLIQDELAIIKEHCYIAYLPLGHMFEFTAEMLFFAVGVRMGYSSPLTLIEGAPGLAPKETPDINLIKPTIFLAVPLVMDRIRRGVTEQLERKPIAKEIFNYLIQYKDYWRNKGYTTPVSNYFLCRKARQTVGSNVRYMLVGGAPVSAETERLIALMFDVKLMQGFGGTEVCGASHARALHDISFGHTGPPLSGFRVRLVDWAEGGYSPKDKPNPRGEIVVNGDSVVSGYYMMEKETNDAFRYENGEKWYYTGDIGEITSYGSFRIIDRRKDLLKLQNGEYYSLGRIEAAVKSCQYLENICVYGISTNDYLIALVLPNLNAINNLAKKFDLEKFSFAQLCKNNRIESTVLSEIREYGLKNGLSKREIPAKIRLYSDEWTPDNGLLTAALKLKRPAIIAKYKTDINIMFNQNIDNINDKNNNNIM